MKALFCAITPIGIIAVKALTNRKAISPDWIPLIDQHPVLSTKGDLRKDDPNEMIGRLFDQSLSHSRDTPIDLGRFWREHKSKPERVEPSPIS